MAVDKSSEKSVRFSAMDSNGGDIKLFLVMVSHFITTATSGLINKQYNFLQGVPIMGANLYVLLVESILGGGGLWVGR